MKPLLEIRNVSLSYHTVSGETKALSNISFDLMPGEFLAVVGPSGCGKSTLLNLICGMLPAEEGTILMNDIPPSPGDPRIGYMLQKDHLLEWRSIYRNILLGLEIRKEKTPEKLAYIEKMLDTYGLDKFRTARPSQLSGGMRQRVVIAIAVACNPQILICDEPTTALDVTIQAQILQLIRDLQKELGMSVIYITHDLGVVANVADRVAVMYAGQIVEYGTVEEIFYDAWHPYTWALLQALPQLGTKGEALPTIDGTPPNLFNEIKGDAFAPRNKHALAIDFVAEPPFFQVSETHAAKTWYLDPRAPKMERPHSIQNLREKMGKMGGSNLNG